MCAVFRFDPACKKHRKGEAIVRALFRAWRWFPVQRLIAQREEHHVSEWSLRKDSFERRIIHRDTSRFDLHVRAMKQLLDGHLIFALPPQAIANTDK